MPYILFTRVDGKRGFMEDTGVMVLQRDENADGEFVLFEQGNDAPIRCLSCDFRESLGSAFAWLSATPSDR
jgi:hypothetical protein